VSGSTREYRISCADHSTGRSRGVLDDQRAPPEDGSLLSPQGTSASARIQLPPELERLLEASNNDQADQAWDEFLTAYGHLLLRTARYTHRGPDASMDAYTFILDRLRRGDFRRLRQFSGGAEEALARWLVVVARRFARTAAGSAMAEQEPLPRRLTVRPDAGWRMKYGTRRILRTFPRQLAPAPRKN